MDILPPLPTASFDADLPCAAIALPGGQCPARLERETRLALRVLAAPTETLGDADPMLVRLEAKIDLALEVSLLARHPERPPLVPCRVGLEALGWLSEQAWAEDEHVLVTLYPNPDSALTLFIPARIAGCAPGPDGHYQIHADIADAFDDATHLNWEKWVFRRHRKAIQER